MSKPRPYDSTVARMAGNIAAGLMTHPDMNPYSNQIVQLAVATARAIVAEVQRTEPPSEQP